MARWSSLLLLVVLIDAIDPSRLAAQSTLSGTLRDAGGAILPGVSVMATSPALDAPRSAVTDQQGRYALADLPDGTYTITFTLPGFVESIHSDIVLPVATGSPLDVVMRVGSLARTITIRPGLRLRGPQDQPTCTMRMIPGNSTIDEEMLKESTGAEDYTIKVVPPPCKASHPAPNR